MKWILLSLTIKLTTFAYAQRIENVDFYVENNRIVVHYDLIHPKPDTLINISLVFRSDKGAKITPVSVTGDLNKVKPGVEKTLIWNIVEDRINLEGNYRAEVEVNKVFSCQEVTIGDQIWMLNNLDVEFFRNGDRIAEAKTSAQWLAANKNKQAAWCYYKNLKNGNYGKLYNGYAISDKRGLAPNGWKLPEMADWKSLVSNYENSINAGNNIRLNSKASFSAQFAGYRNGRDNQFYLDQSSGVNAQTYWWIYDSSKKDSLMAFSVNNMLDSRPGYNIFNKNFGFSVRCLKEPVVSTYDIAVNQSQNSNKDPFASSTASPQKNDKNSFSSEFSSNTINYDHVNLKAVKIGRQVWMSENLKTKSFKNGDIIPQAKTNEEWINSVKNSQPAWCYINNNPTLGAEQGILYNWFALNDPRELAPEGWRIPSYEDVIVLSRKVKRNKALYAYRNRNLWSIWGSDISIDKPLRFIYAIKKFKAFPSESRLLNAAEDMNFDFFERPGMYVTAAWWTRSAGEPGNAYVFVYDGKVITNEQTDQMNGFMVRCIKK
jgi:uncharacterized protein (TIGR02145 family)